MIRAAVAGYLALLSEGPPDEVLILSYLRLVRELAIPDLIELSIVAGDVFEERKVEELPLPPAALDASGDRIRQYLLSVTTFPLQSRIEELALGKRIQVLRRRCRLLVLGSRRGLELAAEVGRGLASGGYDPARTLGVEDPDDRVSIKEALADWRGRVERIEAALEQPPPDDPWEASRALRRVACELEVAPAIVPKFFEGWTAAVVADTSDAEATRRGRWLTKRDRALRNATLLLAAHNQRLAVSLAKHARDRGVSFSNLLHAANHGLARAANRWDYRRGYMFSTYAAWWIRHAVTQRLGGDEELAEEIWPHLPGSD